MVGQQQLSIGQARLAGNGQLIDVVSGFGSRYRGHDVSKRLE